ncbi:MAG: phosphate ABC transporter ATP-binding protein [Bacillota bacterium]|jgi:phosphate transport system ATP-binding protein|nr:phosphate ABC transporter ATP-binding protein [Candidatus Fermentithermobacillaceae bacterium]HAF66897.1 phosphate ABC transporter ATP-binding protein [Clostridiales bacterium UBA9857]HOA70557.1 phosphate ABC transporter ATP-binding protein [Bacillota bacterium]HOP71541.1 phosphate ABC transporter ATP-binding protein [Bacillota bacterium]HPT34911.1 phosphate ABC transporter ATP-binding protein [Bacillota bacterium]
MKRSGYKVEAVEFSYSYGGVPALKQVSFGVKQNSLFTIMGPTGSGKTTFLKALNRLNDLVDQTSRSGRLLLDGKDVYAKDVDVADLRRRVGMVFAMPTSLPMSIFENVAYGPRKRGVKSKAVLEETVEKALSAAALWDEVKDRLDMPAQRLSGGQQQRLAIARALAVQPEVLLLDEPTSGLDPVSTLRVEELMRQLAGSYTIIFVTHDPQQAARLDGEVAFLFMGELIELGTAREMFTRPRDKRTEDYITGKVG